MDSLQLYLDSLQLCLDSLQLYSVQKTIGKCVTDFGYAYVTLRFSFQRFEYKLQGENKLDDMDLNSNRRDFSVRKNRGKVLWFSADCVWRLGHT